MKMEPDSHILSTMLELQAFTPRDLSLNANVSVDEAVKAIDEVSDFLSLEFEGTKREGGVNVYDKSLDVYRIRAGESANLAITFSIQPSFPTKERKLSSPLGLRTAEALRATFKVAKDEEKDEVLRNITSNLELARVELKSRDDLPLTWIDESKKQLTRIHRWTTEKLKEREDEPAPDEAWPRTSGLKEYTTRLTGAPRRKVFTVTVSFTASVRQLGRLAANAVQNVFASPQFQKLEPTTATFIVSNDEIPQELVEKIKREFRTGKHVQYGRYSAKPREAHRSKGLVERRFQTGGANVVVIRGRGDTNSVYGVPRPGSTKAPKILFYGGDNVIWDVSGSAEVRAKAVAKHKHRSKNTRRRSFGPKFGARD